MNHTQYKHNVYECLQTFSMNILAELVGLCVNFMVNIIIKVIKYCGLIM